MVELVSTRASVVGVFASSDALDGLRDAHRVAPDEAMLLGGSSGAAKLAATAAITVEAVDPDAVVLDTTDGWAVWTIEGDGASDVFARLSALELEEGYTQGAVAHVPVRIVARSDRIHLIVPAMWREHIRHRILTQGLPVCEAAEPAQWGKRA